jgi:hypothetical protein
MLAVLAAPAVKKATKKKFFATKNELLSYFLNWKNMIHVLSSLFCYSYCKKTQNLQQ